jgi:hypothetical protein
MRVLEDHQSKKRETRHFKGVLGLSDRPEICLLIFPYVFTKQYPDKVVPFQQGSLDGW